MVDTPLHACSEHPAQDRFRVSGLGFGVSWHHTHCHVLTCGPHAVALPGPAWGCHPQLT